MLSPDLPWARNGGGPSLDDALRGLLQLGLERFEHAGLLLRERELNDRACLELALALRERLGVTTWIGLHDRAHLVQPAGADGLHLGWTSLTPAEARGLVPARTAIGFSSHAADSDARWAGADYLFLSPLREVPKAGAAPAAPLGPAGFEAERARRALPTWALGGVRPDDWGELSRAGADGVAVMSGVVAAGDPRGALADYARALGPGGTA